MSDKQPSELARETASNIQRTAKAEEDLLSDESLAMHIQSALDAHERKLMEELRPVVEALRDGLQFGDKAPLLNGNFYRRIMTEALAILKSKGVE